MPRKSDAQKTTSTVRVTTDISKGARRHEKSRRIGRRLQLSVAKSGRVVNSWQQFYDPDDVVNACPTYILSVGR